MSSNIKMREIRSFDEKDIHNAISLHNKLWNDNRTIKQWIWEYKSNYPNKFVFTVIEDDGNIIGTQGMIPIYINIKNKKYLSGKSENSLLNPKYRGGNLFQGLYELAMSKCKEKKMQFVWGYTTAVKVMKNKIQFYVYENVMYEYNLIVNLKNNLNNILKSKISIIRKILRLIFYSFQYISSKLFSISLRLNKKSLDNKYSISIEPKSFNDIHDLYNRLRIKHPDLIYIDQNKKYIIWRIFNNPNLRYKTYFIYENNKLRGYCYIGINSENNANLSDFTFENFEVGFFLLKKILKDLQDEKIAQISYYGNIKNPLIIKVFKLLKKAGFRKKKGEFSFVLKDISYKNKNQLLNIKNWYLNRLWGEGY